jgi:hypothetical protein
VLDSVQLDNENVLMAPVYKSNDDNPLVRQRNKLHFMLPGSA